MRYEGVVYRPPSEAGSLVLQTTIGCPHNKCRFCLMYRSKRFRIRKVADVLEDITSAAEMYGTENVRSVFLADGNSIIVRHAQLLEILEALYATFPNLRRVTSYGASQYLAVKRLDELKSLATAGLTRIHCGMETGDDELLALIKKGTTAELHIRGGLRVKEAGIELSFYVMPGLGGVERSEQHALGSARVLSAVKPDFIRLRTFSPQRGTEMADACLRGEYTLQTPHQTLREIHQMITHIDAEGSQLLSDHWMNFIEVQGVFPHDKANMLAQVEKALLVPEHHYREVGIMDDLL